MDKQDFLSIAKRHLGERVKLETDILSYAKDYKDRFRHFLEDVNNVLQTDVDIKNMEDIIYNEHSYSFRQLYDYLIEAQPSKENVHIEEEITETALPIAHYDAQRKEIIFIKDGKEIIIDNQSLPDIITERIDSLKKLERFKDEAYDKAQDAIQKANNTNKDKLNWFQKLWRDKTADIEDLQEISKAEGDAIGMLADAIKASYESQKKIAEVENFLLCLGVKGTASSNVIIDVLQKKIEHASQEKLEERELHEFETILRQIKAQESILRRIDKLEEHKEAIDKEFEEKSKVLESKVENAVKDVEQKLKDTSDAILQEQKESIAGMEDAFKENLSRIQERAESLKKSQDAFIADSKTREEKRAQEQKQAFTSFVEENTKRYQVFKSQYEEHKETIDKEFDEKSKALESQVETAIQDVGKKQKETSDALLQEQKENISEMEKTFKENLSRIQERTESLEKSQEAFITDGKTQEEKRAQEQKQAFTSFVEENTKLSQTLKRQLNIYKAISIGATSISIASLLYVVFT